MADEIEIGRRLSDIIFLSEKTEPVDDDWEGYAKQLRSMIADQAKAARAALTPSNTSAG